MNTNIIVLLDQVVNILLFLGKLGSILKPLMPKGKFEEMTALAEALRSYSSVGSLQTVNVPRKYGQLKRSYTSTDEYSKSLAHFINTISVFYGPQAGELLLTNLDPSVRPFTEYYVALSTRPKLYWTAAITSLVNQFKSADEQTEIIMFLMLASTMDQKEGYHTYIDMDAIQARNYSLKKCFVQTPDLNKAESLSSYWDTFKNAAANGWSTLLKNLQPEPEITQQVSIDSFIMEVVDDNITGYNIDNPERFNLQMFPQKY